MNLTDLLKLSASDAPWYAKWYWWLLIGGSILLTLVAASFASRTAQKAKAKKYKQIETLTEQIVKTEITIGDAKIVLEKAAKDRKRIEEIDDEIEEVEERYDDMSARLAKATTLSELRKLREEMVRRDL